jgi:hypothetical protein
LGNSWNTITSAPKILTSFSDEDMFNSTAEEINSRYSKDQSNREEKRTKWLEELEEWAPEMIDESEHLKTVTKFLDSMIKKHPGQKIVVILQYL